jgi:hypothetical protein
MRHSSSSFFGLSCLFFGRRIVFPSSSSTGLLSASVTPNPPATCQLVAWERHRLHWGPKSLRR